MSIEVAIMACDADSSPEPSQNVHVGDERFEKVIFNNGGDVSIFTNVSGVSVQFDIDMSTKVAELVEDIVDTFAIPEDTFYFTHSSKVLETSSTVGQCGMANNFQTVFRGRGGASKVKQTIRKKTDKKKLLKGLKQSYEDEETDLKACVKAPRGAVDEALDGLEARITKVVSGSASEDGAVKQLVSLMSELDTEQLQKLQKKLSARTSSKDAKIVWLSALLFAKEMSVVDNLQTRITSLTKTMRAGAAFVMEQSSKNMGWMKQVSSAILNQKIGAAASGSAGDVSIDADAIVKMLGSLELADSDGDF